MTSSSERRARLLALLLALLPAVAATSVATKAAAAPSASDLESARALRKEGKKLRAEKDFAGALQKFKAAYALVPTPVTGYELATAYADVHRLLEARAQAIAVTTMPTEADETGLSVKAREDAKKLAADLAPRIPTLRVKIVAAPAGATLTVDAEQVPIEVAGAGRKLDPGKHVAVARAPGVAERRAEIELAEGDDKELVLAFETTVAPSAPPETKADTPPMGPAPSSTAPAATAPFAASKLPPNSRDETPSPPPATADLPPSTSGLVWIGLGVAAPAIVVGTVTGALAISGASDVKRGCTGNVCDPSVKSKYDTASALAAVSTVSFVVAAGGAALMIVGLRTGPSSHGSLRTRWTVGVAYLGVDGSF